MHFLPCIHFIQAELDKGRGVLVHCHAGISMFAVAYRASFMSQQMSAGRSSTIVAAYLMYSQKITPLDALELVRKARPIVEYVSRSVSSATVSIA